MMANGMNGSGWKVATILFGLLASIAMWWTSDISADSKGRDEKIAATNKRQTATEENVRTIHYEAQIQRRLLESIADAVDADTGPVPPVRPLREVD